MAAIKRIIILDSCQNILARRISPIEKPVLLVSIPTVIFINMSATVAGQYKAKVKNGVIEIPASLKLAEGATVQIIPLDPLPSDPPFLKGILKMSKPRNWPKDFALNHAHYTKGHPKR